MDYRKFGECYYIRMDRDDEIISTILEICKKENIRSATFPESEDARMQKSRPLSQRQAASKNSAFLECLSWYL